MLGYLTLLSALFISVTAAYYSIVGLISIFSGAVIPIAVMGVALELGKVISAAWLHQHWRNPKVPILLRTYLTGAVVVLVFITSLGIFGFLSKAHLEQSIQLGGNTGLQIESLQRQIDNERRQINDAEVVISQLDTQVQTLIEYDRIRGDDGAMAVRERQKDEREDLNASINTAYERINELQTELLPLQRQRLELEVEVGPLKYVAELIYGDSAEDYFDEAVRWVIIAFIFVFDPLAILMLLAGIITLRKEPLAKPVQETVEYTFTPPTEVDTFDTVVDEEDGRQRGRERRG